MDMMRGHIMKILFVQNQLCSRAWKEAKVLNTCGIDLSLIELGYESSSKDHSIFKNIYIIPVNPDMNSMVKGKNKIIKGLKKIVKENNFDLIHIHNEPDNLGYWAKKNLDIPVVHDVHDLMSLKPIPWAKGPKKWIVRKMYNKWEKEICQNADGIMAPSLPMMKFIEKKYSPKRMAYVDNKPVKESFSRKEKIPGDRIHAVYSGGIGMDPESPRYLWPMFKELCDHGLKIHLYPPVFKKNEYEPIRSKCNEIKGMIFHLPVAQHEVIPEISQYHFGLVIFKIHTENIKMATSNRVYEYQIAGLPIITNDIGHIAEYIKEKGCGEVISEPDDIKGILSSNKDYILDTDDCFMDPGPIIDLYKKILNKK